MQIKSIRSLLVCPKACFSKFKGRRTWRIFAGDLVQVVKGPERGKQGKITRVLRTKEQAIVEGINVKEKEVLYDTETQKKGDIELYTEPIDVRMINLVDPSINKATRIKTGYLEDGTMVRISKKTGTIIYRPSQDHMKIENQVKDKVDGPLDTKMEKAHEVTYTGEDFESIRKEFDEFINEKERIEKLLVFDE